MKRKPHRCVKNISFEFSAANLIKNLYFTKQICKYFYFMLKNMFFWEKQGEYLK